MVIAGVVSALAALCYAEFASSVPIAGSAYTYAYATLGEFIAWIIGWDLILEYALGAATVAVGWSGNVVQPARRLRDSLPRRGQRRAGHGGAHWPTAATATAVFNLPAVLIAAAGHAGCSCAACEESATVNAVMVVDQGRDHPAGHRRRRLVRPSRRTTRPFIPPNTGAFGEFGWSGIVRGAAVIFFAYIGFDAVSTAAQEARNPQRDMPRGILGSLAICTVLYVAVVGGDGRSRAVRELGGPAPMAVAVDHARAGRGGHGWSGLMSVDGRRSSRSASSPG